MTLDGMDQQLFSPTSRLDTFNVSFYLGLCFFLFLIEVVRNLFLGDKKPSFYVRSLVSKFLFTM